MLSDLLMWNKIGRIVTRLSERMNIDIATVLDLFYRSKTCADLHNPETELYLNGDLYIVNEFTRELATK